MAVLLLDGMHFFSVWFLGKLRKVQGNGSSFYFCSHFSFFILCGMFTGEIIWLMGNWSVRPLSANSERVFVDFLLILVLNGDFYCGVKIARKMKAYWR